MYSNSANGSTNSWAVRTSTPKKMSVYDFEPGPSTSFDSIASLPSLADLIGQSSSKSKTKKGSTISMICEAIEAVGSPTKGASYIAIYKWIISIRKTVHPKRLRTLIRKEISKALENGLLKRSANSKTAVGVQGYFIINNVYSRNNSRNNVRFKPKFKRTKNAAKAKANPVKTTRSIQKSKEDPIPEDPTIGRSQSVLASIMKTKEAFEEAAQSILQQASKVLEVATKLIEASNSLVLNKLSQQNTDGTNPDVEMSCVVSMQSRQDEEARVASIQCPQGGEARAAPMLSVQDEVRVAPLHSVQGIAQVPPLQSVQGEARAPPLQSVQGEARAPPLQSVQGEARVAPLQSVQGEALVAPFQSVQGEALVAPLQSVQGGEARVASIQQDQDETKVAQMNAYQAEKERAASLRPSQSEHHQVAPIQSLCGADNPVVRNLFPEDSLLRVTQIQSSQITEAQVASVQPFQILETKVASKQNIQIVDSSVDQCFPSFEDMNNTSQRELPDEELSVQRSLNLSSDYSFGVEVEVSNLIHHLEDQLK